MTLAELFANGFTAASIVLAGRNSVHTWWTGILSGVLFGWVFYLARLYADVTLQGFFVVTSVVGWWGWLHGAERRALPIRTTPGRWLAVAVVAGSGFALAYALLLHHFTDAYAPGPDSVVLSFSIVSQFLLVARRVETWWGWLEVDTIAVPLYLSRGLTLTALLYAGFWVNALVSLRHWRRQLEAP